MLIICEDCAKRYNIDETRIHGKRARFTCKECGHIIIVDKTDTSRRLVSEPAVSTTSDKALETGSGTEVLLKELIDGEAGSASDNSLRARKKSFIDKLTKPSFTFFFLITLIFTVLVTAGIFGYIYLTQISKGIQVSHAMLWCLAFVCIAWIVSMAACLAKAYSLSRSINDLRSELIALVKGEKREVVEKKGARELVDLTRTISKIIRLRDYI